MRRLWRDNISTKKFEKEKQKNGLNLFEQEPNRNNSFPLNLHLFWPRRKSQFWGGVTSKLAGESTNLHPGAYQSTPFAFHFLAQTRLLQVLKKRLPEKNSIFILTRWACILILNSKYYTSCHFNYVLESLYSCTTAGVCT